MSTYRKKLDLRKEGSPASVPGAGSRSLPLLVIALIALLSAGCADGEERLVEALDRQEISGDRLWTRITEETDFENYGFWPGHEGYRQGQAPHGPVHRIFVNQPLLSQIPLEPPVAPDGSIIVKENRLGDRTLTGYTVMAKVEGYAPGTGDWFWARYEPDGSIAVEGTVPGCISCHGGVQNNDYVIVYPLDLPPEEAP